jgi:putative membrane protein
MILGLLIKFLVMSVAVFIIAKVLPGMRLKGFKTAFVVALVYSLLNIVFFKLLIFITFPLVALKYLTLGIFGIVINAVLLVITDKILEDFEMSSFGTALIAALSISVINLVLSFVLHLARFS